VKTPGAMSVRFVDWPPAANDDGEWVELVLDDRVWDAVELAEAKKRPVLTVVKPDDGT
jgi:hypothetical protein